MSTTLSERIKLAMKGPPKVSGVQLARACVVSGASVSDWKTGKTKSIEGANLTKAAECLKVRAKWLAEGVGPMRDTVFPQHQISEPTPAALDRRRHDKMTTELVALFNQLDKASKHEYLGQLRGFVMGRSKAKDPPAEQIAPANKENTGTYD